MIGIEERATAAARLSHARVPLHAPKVGIGSDWIAEANAFVGAGWMVDAGERSTAGGRIGAPGQKSCARGRGAVQAQKRKITAAVAANGTLSVTRKIRGPAGMGHRGDVRRRPIASTGLEEPKKFRG